MMYTQLNSQSAEMDAGQCTGFVWKQLLHALVRGRPRTRDTIGDWNHTGCSANGTVSQRPCP